MEVKYGPVGAVILEARKGLEPVGTGSVASCEIHSQFKRTEDLAEMTLTHPAGEYTGSQPILVGMFQLKVTPVLGKVQLWSVPDAHWWVVKRSVEFDMTQTSSEGMK